MQVHLCLFFFFSWVVAAHAQHTYTYTIVSGPATIRIHVRLSSLSLGCTSSHTNAHTHDCCVCVSLSPNILVSSWFDNRKHTCTYLTYLSHLSLSFSFSSASADKHTRIYTQHTQSVCMCVVSTISWLSFSCFRFIENKSTIPSTQHTRIHTHCFLFLSFGSWFNKPEHTHAAHSRASLDLLSCFWLENNSHAHTQSRCVCVCMCADHHVSRLSFSLSFFDFLPHGCRHTLHDFFLG